MSGLRTAVAAVARRIGHATWLARGRAKTLWWRIAYPGIRIGRGVHVHPGSYLAAHDGGTIVIGDGSEIGARSTLIAEGGHIAIGAASHVGIGAVLIARDRISIGRDALISQYVAIRDHDHGVGPDGPYRLQPQPGAPVRIGDNVWLGTKATVLKGVGIGDHAVVGANAVVTRDLEGGTLAVGAPARVIRRLR
jgi:acetyltransferase-like isoleucine patch superfamily enzyme